MVFLSGLLILQRPRPDLTQLWRSPKQLSVLLTTAALLAFNWGIYIYGVNSNQVVQTSLGYYINPLVNVLLGYVFLKERLHWGQRLAVVLASIGVAYFIWQFGGRALDRPRFGLFFRLIWVTAQDCPSSANVGFSSGNPTHHPNRPRPGHLLGCDRFGASGIQLAHHSIIYRCWGHHLLTPPLVQQGGQAVKIIDPGLLSVPGANLCAATGSVSVP